ncbi:MAG: MFS transporter [Escherichia coli]|nr:MFS transporter [Escherichia coli]
MKTTAKLSFMMFVEWFIWGAWFVPLWLWLSKSGFSAGEIGWSYACTAIAAILSPILVGSITDRFFSAQLTNSIAFANVPDVERDFPRIRVMGTIGWIASGLACGFLPQILGYADISPTNIPLLITAGSSALLGVFAFFLPDTPPKSTGKMDIKVMLGLDALILLRDKNFLVFFFCSFLFAMPLAFYYIFANGYLTEVGMKNATGWMTLGQFSEIFFMLALPFFTKRFGIKKVLLLGLVTAAIRYGFFIYGSADEYFTYALLFLGILGGVMMEKMFAYQEPVNGLTFNWSGMWTFGAVMIAIIAVLFMIFFRESDNEITAIKVDDRDIALTQGEVK